MAPAVQVEIRDPFGNRVTTATDAVTLAIANNAGGGTLSGSTTVQASSGVATFSNLSIDKAASGYDFAAGAAGLLSTTSSAFAINVGQPTQLGFVVQPADTPAGDATVNPIFPSVQVSVQDAFGNTVTTVPNTNISLAIGNNPSGSGQLTGTLVGGTTLGVATFADLHIDKVGNGYTLVASTVSYAQGTSAPFKIVPDIPDSLSFAVQPVDTQASANIFPAPKVAVFDAFGNVVTSATDTITIAKTQVAGTLSGTLVQSVVSGLAPFGDLSIDITGTYNLAATSAAGLTSATSNSFTITPQVADHLDFIVQPTDVITGAAMTPAVQVQVSDINQNPVTTSSVMITLAIANNPGGSSFHGTLSVAALNGVATFSDLSLTKTGSGYTLSATSPGLSSSTSGTFNVAPGPMTHFHVQSPASTNISTQIAGTPFDIRVAANDQFHNVVTDFTGTVQITSNAALEGAPVTSGFFNAGILIQSVTIDSAQAGTTLTVAVPGITSSSNGFTVIPGDLDHFRIEKAGGGAVADQTAGASFSIQVTAQDAKGNTITAYNSSVQITANATLSGAPVNSGTFTGGVLASQTLTITSAQSGTILTVSGAGQTGSSNPFTVAAGAPAKLVFSTPPADTTAGTMLSPAPQVSVFDNFGNHVSGATNNVTVAIATNPGGGTLSGTNTVAAVGGVATFSNLSIDRAAQGYTLSAASGPLAGAVSGTFNVSAGPPARLVYVAQPQGGTGGAVMSPDVHIAVQDASGNTISGSSGTISVTLAQKPPGGTLSGTTTDQVLNGIATFGNLIINKAGSGYTLSAKYASLPAAESSPFSINVGPGSALVFTTQPSRTEAGAAISPAVQVSVLDAGGNVVTTATQKITMSLGSNRAAATLSGTTTIAADKGVASFTNLSLDVVGQGYTLTAAGSGLGSAVSAGFDVVDTTAPSIQSGPMAGASTANVGEALTFSVVASDAQALTYTWNFGDGSVVTTQDGSISHTFVAPGAYQVTVTVTDPNGNSNSGSLTVAALDAQANITNGLPTAELVVQQIGVKFAFPSSLNKDVLALKGTIQLPAGFNPAGALLKWQVGGLIGSTTLNSKGSSALSPTVKASLRYKKPAKGQAFTSRPGKLTITARGQSFGAFKLNGVSSLNATTAGTKGQTATVDAFVVLAGNGYARTNVSGTYKAKQDKGGLFMAR